MADKLFYVPNDVTQNYLFFRLQLVDETLGHSTEWINLSNSLIVPKVVHKIYFLKSFLCKNLFFAHCLHTGPIL